MRPFSTLSTSLIAATCAVLFLAGCEAVGQSSTIELTEGVGTLRYTFSTDENGNLVNASEVESVNLGPFLEEQGFTREEVLSAHVVPGSVVLEVTSPTLQNLDILDSAILQLQGEDIVVEVAERSQNFPEEDDTVSLNVHEGGSRDIGDLVRLDSFDAVLQLGMSGAEPNEEYEFALVLEVKVELEGV